MSQIPHPDCGYCGNDDCDFCSGHPEGREPRPELAAHIDAHGVLQIFDDGLWLRPEPGDYWIQLALTADEREKLIGGEG